MADSYGYLIVSVTTAINTIPVIGAAVAVSQRQGGVDTTLQILTTDINGQTPKIQLPAPPRVNSLTPNPTGPSYTLYNITVQKDGYYPATSLNIPIFAGITSIQSVRLLPYVGAENIDQPEFTPELPPSESRVNPDLQQTDNDSN